MKVIVTGGSGRIGKFVIEKLVARGYEVINLDRRPADRPGAKFIYMDLRRRDLLQPVMEQAQVIVHMGEIPSATSGHATEEEVFGQNCTVGSLVFQLALELNYQRVIYTSTIQVYGFTGPGAIAPAKMPIDETHPLQAQNCYGLSKIAIESYAGNCAAKRGLSIAVFRLPWVMTHPIDDHWFRWVENQDKLDDDLGMYVHGSDVGECFALAIEKPRPGFEAYNLGAREVMFAGPIREAMTRHYPNYPQLPEGWGRFDMPYVWRKAREHFGWEPKWNFLDEYRKKFGRDPQVECNKAS